MKTLLDQLNERVVPTELATGTELGVDTLHVLTSSLQFSVMAQVHSVRYTCIQPCFLCFFSNPFMSPFNSKNFSFTCICICDPSAHVHVTTHTQMFNKLTRAIHCRICVYIQFWIPYASQNQKGIHVRKRGRVMVGEIVTRKMTGRREEEVKFGENPCIP